MGTKNKFQNLLLVSAIALIPAISACTPVKATRGNMLAQEQVQQIQPGVSHKSDVARILGTPSTRAIFDENTWYYVGMHTEQSAFFDPEVVDKRVMKVTFDDMDMVVAINDVTNEGIDVPISSRVTPTGGQDLTVVQQLLGNIGRFNPQSELNDN
jgi:outer membrane protein assembly factor BamE (lipoprotein component of BamABCDE complex)